MQLNKESDKEQCATKPRHARQHFLPIYIKYEIEHIKISVIITQYTLPPPVLQLAHLFMLFDTRSLMYVYAF